MHLELLGNVGYQVGAVGIAIVTILYLVFIRWWTDYLGRAIAAVVSSMSLVLVISTMRMLGVQLPGNFFIWRVGVFWFFGLAVWSGLIGMVWAQFLAPRLKRQGVTSRLTTPPQSRKDYRNEEADLASSWVDRDGSVHDDSGSAH